MKKAIFAKQVLSVLMVASSVLSTTSAVAWKAKGTVNNVSYDRFLDAVQMQTMKNGMYLGSYCKLSCEKNFLAVVTRDGNNVKSRNLSFAGAIGTTSGVLFASRLYTAREDGPLSGGSSVGVISSAAVYYMGILAIDEKANGPVLESDLETKAHSESLAAAHAYGLNTAQTNRLKRILIDNFTEASRRNQVVQFDIAQILYNNRMISNANYQSVLKIRALGKSTKVTAADKTLSASLRRLAITNAKMKEEVKAIQGLRVRDQDQLDASNEAIAKMNEGITTSDRLLQQAELISVK